MNNSLALNKEEASALYSLENYLIKKDVEKEENLDKKVIKKLWLKKWQNGILTFLRIKSGDDNMVLEESYEDIINYMNSETVTSYKKRAILIELLTFSPYYNLEEKDNKQYSGLKFDRKQRRLMCGDIAEETGLNRREVDDIEALYKSSYSFYTERMKSTVIKVASVVGAGVLFASGAWMFAPAVIPVFTAAGITGAAAITAGIAVLGGGTLNISEDINNSELIVYICGGGILGCNSDKANDIAIKLVERSPEYTLVQTIKLDCAIKYIYILNEDEKIEVTGEAIVKEIVEQMKTTMDNLMEKATVEVEEINRLKLAGDKRDMKEKQLGLEKMKRSIGVMEKLIARYGYVLN